MRTKSRSLTLVVLLVLVAAVSVLLVANREKWRDYRIYMWQDAPEIEMRYAELTTATDEKAARKHFPTVFLRCYDEPAAGNLGDRVCYSDITRADGLPAMFLGLFFEKGKLKSTIVRLPWWRHFQWRGKLLRDYGKVNAATIFSILDGPLVQWNLANGAFINFTRDPSLNPMQWSMIRFTPGDPPVSAPAPAATAEPAAQAAPQASEAPAAVPAPATSAPRLPKLPMPIL